jgi:hypothetical protein
MAFCKCGTNPCSCATGSSFLDELPRMEFFGRRGLLTGTRLCACGQSDQSGECRYCEMQRLTAERDLARKKAEAWKEAALRGASLRDHWESDCDQRHDCVSYGNKLDLEFDEALEAARALEEES